MMDSIPVVAITGQVSTKLIGSDAFQEADTFGITRSCTKHNFLVKKLSELPQIVHEAFPHPLPPGPAAPAQCWSIFPRTCSRPPGITRRSRTFICPATKSTPKVTRARFAAPRK